MEPQADNLELHENLEKTEHFEIKLSMNIS